MNRRRREVAAVLIVLVCAVVALFCGYGLRPDWGLGPGWECSFQPWTEICFKKRSVQLDNSN